MPLAAWEERNGPGATAGDFRRGCVLVDSPHEHAWREALTGFAEPAGFTTVFYQAYVAGKPRLEGARAALEGLGGVGATARAAEYAGVKQALMTSLSRATGGNPQRFRQTPGVIEYTIGPGEHVETAAGGVRGRTLQCDIF